MAYIGKKPSDVFPTSAELDTITSTNLNIDASGDITLDADGGNISIKDGGTTVGNIGNDSTDLYIAGTTHGIKFDAIDASTMYIRPVNNSGTNLTGQIDLGQAGNVFRDAYVSGGVYFAPNSYPANYLDDYEEGTFTPAINSGATGGSYANTGGNYTKIGNMVTFTIRLQPGSFTGNGDGFNLSGLPFTSATGVREGGGFFNYLGNFEDPMPTIHVGAGGTLVSFFTQSGSGLVGNTINNLNVTIHIQGFYYTS